MCFITEIEKNAFAVGALPQTPPQGQLETFPKPLTECEGTLPHFHPLQILVVLILAPSRKGN